jgi:hypothetical protein
MRPAGRNDRAGSAGSISAPLPLAPRVAKRQVDIHQPRSRQRSAPRPSLLLGRLCVAATPIVITRVSKTESSM